MLSSALKRVNRTLSPGKVWTGPEWLVLGVNNLCNLHCKMCDVGTGHEGSNFQFHLTGAKPLNMPLELIRKIFDQAARHYPRAKMGYAFTEPIIYPHLVESIDYASHKGLFTSITTNALKLRNLAEDLAKAGLGEVYVSLDGPEEIHNEIRGNKFSFQWALEGMEKTLAVPGSHPEISVFVTITEWNIGHLTRMVKALRHLPMKRMGFMHTNYTTPTMAAAHNAVWGQLYQATESNVEGIDLGRMDLSLLLDEIREIKGMNLPYGVSFSPELNTLEELNTFYHSPEKKIGRVCNDAFRNLMIKSDGSCIPAHGRCYRVEAGNLNSAELPEIWNSAPLAQFRKDLLKAGGLMPACTRCCSAF
jgi:sulfatase maturation enzyme AslB (radical SAM superfamily)